MAIRFHESDVREMGRVATGVRGIRLRGDDVVVGMVVVSPDAQESTTLLVLTERGRGKRTPIEDYRYQGRGGMGVINFKLSDQTGRVLAIKGVTDAHELMLITRKGVVTRQRVGEIRVIGRNTQGVRVMALDEGDVLMDVARVIPEDDEDVELTDGVVSVDDVLVVGDGGPDADDDGEERGEVSDA
jgi:DNA gyrase subunit A